MPIKSFKALLGLTLVASYSLALTPLPATAADLERIVVVGDRPQSRQAIEEFLSHFRQQATWHQLLPEYSGLEESGEGSPNEVDSFMHTLNGCTTSQDGRTATVARTLSGNQGSPNFPASTYLTIGTEIHVRYMNERSEERFVVTGVNQSSNPNFPSGRMITPVEGTFVCRP